MGNSTRLAKNEPLVPLLANEDMTPSMRAVADQNIKRMGRVANSARAFANAGDLGTITRKYYEDSWANGTLPLEFRLLVRYVVANANACVYCQTHQVQLLQKAGIDAEKLAHIHEFETHSAFNERERAAMAFAKAQTLDAANIADDIAQRFVDTFPPAERAEISIIAATMSMLNAVNDALRVPLETKTSELLS